MTLARPNLIFCLKPVSIDWFYLITAFFIHQFSFKHVYLPHFNCLKNKKQTKEKLFKTFSTFRCDIFEFYNLQNLKTCLHVSFFWEKGIFGNFFSSSKYSHLNIFVCFYYPRTHKYQHLVVDLCLAGTYTDKKMFMVLNFFPPNEREALEQFVFLRQHFLFLIKCSSVKKCLSTFYRN